MSAPGTGAASATGGRRLNTFDIFVGNLPPDADQKKIGKVFSRFGEIQGIFIKDPGDGNKFAFVKFFCEEDSLRAIEEINGTLFEGGKILSVRKANKRGARKDGDQEGNQNKEESRQPFPLKQGNPDIVPSFEANQEMQHPFSQMRKENEKMLISYVETPVVLWAQRMNQQTAKELGSITEQLSNICPESTTITGKPEPDKIYGAKFSEDQQWYRCTVRYQFSPERVKVQYIDYGNTEELNPNTLVELPMSLTSMPACSMKIMLHSLYCNNSQDQIAIQFLRDLVDGQEVEVATTARLSDHTGFYADISMNGVSACDKMVEGGYCFKKPLEQRGFKPRMLNSGDATPGNSSGFSKHNMGQLPGQRKFDGDKDSLKWKLKNLQTEYTTLSNKAQENDLSKQIQNLKVLTSSVRKLRNQFPLDKVTPLDTAVSLVQGPGKISLDSVNNLPDVLSAFKAYRTAQDEIRKCSDKSILAEQIVSRNEIRRDLFDKLDSFITEVSSMPLQDRGKNVQDVVSALAKHYDSYTKMSISSLPSLESLLPAYDEWKAKKKVEVIDAQRQSDTMESSVNTLLSQLKTVLSLDLSLEEAELSDDLAPTLKAYKEALQQETSLWNNDNAQDMAVVASLVQVVLQDLTTECGCVEQLNSMVEEFCLQQRAITPWLNSSPSLDALHEVRKKLKSLKSKLRHMLADKADAEENQDTDELETIMVQLEELRGKMHKALKDEDRQLNELGKLASDHFPELLSSEQDGGFASYLTYKGLLKMSHSPDHYTFTPVDSEASNIFVSVFDDEPIIIKEYFLSDGNHLDREEFLSKMLLYTNASSPYLEPVQAAFFDKSNRHAYVQVNKEGELLSTHIQQTVLSKQQIQEIVKCLCLSLQALHQFNFVHGQIQPDYVLLDAEGKARLLPPDFSLTDADRCRTKYQTESNMEMTAPEMKQTMMPVEIGHAIDVYCLGLLTLWMHYPSHQFSEGKNGVDISGVQMDRNLGIFVTKLLCPNPMLRPTAENCLRSEYLCLPVDRPATASPMMQTMYPSEPSSAAELEQALRGGRNSASPSSTDGRGYADSLSGIQMIANTRVPPPSLNSSATDGGGGVLAPSPIPTLPPALSPASPSMAIQQQQQQQQILQQQQLQQLQFQQMHQQQMELQQQQNFQQQNPSESGPSPQPPPPQRAQQDGAFEIGTFDPTAYEVVTSPQPQPALESADTPPAEESPAPPTQATEEDEGWEDAEEEDAS